jgi:DNA polymerase-1
VAQRNSNEDKRISAMVIADKSTAELKASYSFIKSLMELRKSQKLEKTYINGTRKAMAYNEEDKIYVDFRIDGTVTGRLSCAAYTAKKPMGVSFHTLPRETKNNIRSTFVAPGYASRDIAGWKFITADYSTMELRILAHISKDGNMQKAFLNNEDLHTYTAQLLFQKEEITKEQRQIAKSVSFLLVYGGGAFNLSETTGISMGRAEAIIAKYAEVFPGVFEYMEHVNKFVKENGYAYSIFGRRRNLPNVTSRDFKVVNGALRQGLNFTVQSPASDVLMCVLLGIEERFAKEGLQARPVATVHDSIEAVCPPEEEDRVIDIIYDEMVNYHKVKELFNIHFDVPLEIELEVGTSFGNGKEVNLRERYANN